MAVIKINRGTTRTMAFEYRRDGEPRSLVGATLRFTVKATEWDSDADDSTALIRKDITEHTDAAAGESEIILTPADTDVTPGKYYWDIRVEESTGEIYKVAEGRLKVDGSPTNRNNLAS